MIKLSYEQSDAVRSIYCSFVKHNEILSPALDILYVIASDKKPLTDFEISKETYNEIYFPLVFLKGKNLNFQASNNNEKIKITLFNPNIINSQELKKFLSSAKTDHTAKGKMYGYPDCCINSFPNNTGKISFLNEYNWCSDDCADSLKLERIYLETILENIPEFIGFASGEMEIRSLDNMLKYVSILSQSSKEEVYSRFITFRNKVTKK